MSAGIWVRFRRAGGQAEEQAWLSIGRAWFMELRADLAGAWREEYGEKTPRDVSPKAWVSEQLRKRGIRLNGREITYLPYALFARIRIAADGDSTGPRGEWTTHDTILPGRRIEPMGGIRIPYRSPEE